MSPHACSTPTLCPRVTEAGEDLTSFLCRWAERAVSRLEGMKNSRCVNFSGSWKYRDFIDWLPSSMMTSASSGEATHKELKQAWVHSNK